MHTPVAKATLLFRKRNSEPLTAPSAEGAVGAPPRKASPERGGARLRRAEGFVPPRRNGRGGSVSRRDLNQAARNRTQLSGGTNSEETTTPNASRSSGGSAREGLLSEKPPPSHIHVLSYSSGKGVWGRGASLREAASPPESPSYPTSSLEEGARGRGLFYQKRPLPRNFS